jgi:DNA-directed RNA polymerase specialized sigma24 family protein
MGKHNNYPGIDPRITRIVAIEAAKVASRLKVPGLGIKDIEQELHCHVSSSLPKAKEVALEKAVQQIVKHGATDIVRKYLRQRRTSEREAFSMNSPSLDAEDSDSEMTEMIDLESARRSFFGLPPAWHEYREGTSDFTEALAELPGDLRKLADALEASGGNLMEAARTFGLSHKKARIMRERLQRALEWLWDDDV